MKTYDAIILDTETTDLDGVVIQLAHGAVTFQTLISAVVPVLNESSISNSFFSAGDHQISYAAMAVHHIVEADLLGKPDTSTLRIPENTKYIIGHNIHFDMKAMQRSNSIDLSEQVKTICTLALARHTWPDLPSHSLSALIYFIHKGSYYARDLLAKAHDAKTDIICTALILKEICRAKGITNFEDLYELSQIALIPTKMPFGKYRKMPIHQVPRDYMTRYLAQADIDQHVAKAFQAHLDQPIKATAWAIIHIEREWN